VSTDAVAALMGHIAFGVDVRNVVGNDLLPQGRGVEGQRKTGARDCFDAFCHGDLRAVVIEE
jgi:hypothetical protein